MIHDPLCPDNPHSEVFFWVRCECALIAKVRSDERRRFGEQAQAAVALLNIRHPKPASYSIDLALAWQDGWTTGHSVALSRVARDAEETE